MGWISIVLWIVIHIPDFINIIKMILDLIHGMPFLQREAVRMDISDAIKSGDKEVVKQRLRLHAGMVGNAPETVTI